MANGLYTNAELIGSVIDDLNTILKMAMTGQPLQACAVLTGTAQKLINLQETINNDLKNRDETIKTLEDELRKGGIEIVHVSADKLTGENNE